MDSPATMARGNGVDIPEFGRRLMPTMIDTFARSDPPRTYATMPFSDADLSLGFRKINYAQFAAAINKMAYWLDECLGPPATRFETFAYYGPRDLRYAVMIIASIKTGRKLLLTSLLAAQEAQVHLARASNCRIFLYAESAPASVRDIPQQFGGPIILAIPSLNEVFDDSKPAPHYPYAKAYEEAAKDEIVIYHTSGTTGFPKLVTYTNEMLARMDCWNMLPDIDGMTTSREFYEGRRLYLTLPIFHLAGTLLALPCPVFLNTIVTLGPAEVAVTPQIFDQVRQYGSIEGGLFPPGLLEDTIRRSDLNEGLKQLDLICYCGAPLSKAAGDWIAPLGTLRTCIGSTEGSYWPTVRPLDEDWDYIRFHPGISPAFCHHVDNLYELRIRRTSDSERFTNFFRAFPGLDVFDTKDLWAQHPTKPYLWKYHGRTDDLIVLKGEVKMYAGHLEDKLRDHKKIRHALVGGQERDIPFLLLEVADGEIHKNPEVIIDEVWPLVEQSNKDVLEQMRLRKSLTLVATPGKPFVRLGKGSVDRRNTFKRYAHEIECLYGSG